MITILFRTLTIYLVLILIMRLMGKRQIGELEVTDLVTTLLLSEIASLPITNRELPISHALVPMTILFVMEVVSSWILIRHPRLRGLVSAKPTVIIHRGKLRQSALESLRISIDELMSEIRQQGLSDLSQVETAILEKNGKLTILPKPSCQPPTAEDLGIKPSGEALMHIIWQSGMFSKEGLRIIGKDRPWVDRQLKKRKLSYDSLFCVMANEDGKLFWIEKEKQTK